MFSKHLMIPHVKSLALVCVLILFSCSTGTDSSHNYPRSVIHEINETEISSGQSVIAIVGATLIDGISSGPIMNSCVIVRNQTIERVGKAGEVLIPAEAEIIDGKGLTLLPGLIDAHYHNEESLDMGVRFLRQGVTSVRDPGAWIEAYDSLRSTGRAIPRLFLTGPHINGFPPAYPKDAYVVRDPVEGGMAVHKLASQGATAIKVYYGLPLGTIEEVCKAAHAHGLPVTAHLEFTDVKDAIEAGLDGIEHITSFGSFLMVPREAEAYKQRVMADNNARKRGRYEIWNSLALDNNPKKDSLIRFLALHKTFVSATLAIFERQDDTGDSIEVNGFRNMIKFAGQLKKGGATLVVGSHTWVPYAEPGFAYMREMELLQQAGLTPMEVLQAATIENARFLHIEERLGSIEEGKMADMIVVDGNPLRDISAMRKVKRVMLNGVWVSSAND
jgi:imidazolonepropionase-like amidohydrolase